mmetsp:Transcript_36653/g.80321  ORF Transcript_36653/g.80321 Transcript_36653/m.80321 type:complete len:290 (-) Transcript_36653:81-950(-)|eukprot:CAMPEP_0170617552 /NCGR_PEP_ID=MMETSP0224-20130122/26482_1 /TAXON_ID=285029 /ORGANISM="Togula jolla, Strain CCCM 725" /LENGTH=289 /DNA_ID=CAMNT_0010943459 /DNA_START=86 /DNA_END=955 /DNA_ORIENTATION=+
MAPISRRAAPYGAGKLILVACFWLGASGQDPGRVGGGWLGNWFHASSEASTPRCDCHCCKPKLNVNKPECYAIPLDCPRDCQVDDHDTRVLEDVSSNIVSFTRYCSAECRPPTEDEEEADYREQGICVGVTDLADMSAWTANATVNASGDLDGDGSSRDANGQDDASGDLAYGAGGSQDSGNEVVPSIASNSQAASISEALSEAIDCGNETEIAANGAELAAVRAATTVKDFDPVALAAKYKQAAGKVAFGPAPAPAPAPASRPLGFLQPDAAMQKQGRVGRLASHNFP